MDDWLSIETAPKDGTEFLAFGPHGRVITHWMREDYFRDGQPARWFPANNPTHWMPLPVPPNPLERDTSCAKNSTL